MRVIDDNEAIAAGKKTRPYNRGNQGFPSTVQYHGGKGAVKLPDTWITFVQKMTPKFISYIFSKAKGWQNSDQTGLVQQVTFSGNVVAVDRIENGQAYIHHFRSQDGPPLPIAPTIQTLTDHPEIQAQELPL